MKELYSLYPHQQEAIDLIKESFEQGLTRPLLYASVAFGKTVVAAHIVSQALNDGLKVCFVVPFTILIDQTHESFVKQGIPEAGVIQADHEKTDPTKMLQIASVQTLLRRRPEGFDLYIIDEAHAIYSEIVRIAEETETPMIGLSGSPYSKGLGKIYNNLIVTKTMAQLINEKYLSDYIAFGPSQPDMNGAKTNMGDYQVKDAGERASDTKLIGSITENWVKLGENEPTICFACNVAHAEFLGIAFDKIGVSNEVITAKTPMDERKFILHQFSKGLIKILINIGTLTTGMDEDVRCIIYARPTKSMILWTQMAGRSLRLAEGKERAIMLDHAGNFERLGRPEDYTIDALDDGKKNEAGKHEQKERAEKLPKTCPKCHFLKDAGVHECPNCGFTPVYNEDVETEKGDLIQIKGRPQKPRTTTDNKQQFWSELQGYREVLKSKGKNYADGWFAYKFKARFDEWPNGLNKVAAEPSPEMMGWIRSQNIAYAKSKEKR